MYWHWKRDFGVHMREGGHAEELPLAPFLKDFYHAAPSEQGHELAREAEGLQEEHAAVEAQVYAARHAESALQNEAMERRAEVHTLRAAARDQVRTNASWKDGRVQDRLGNIRLEERGLRYRSAELLAELQQRQERQRAVTDAAAMARAEAAQAMGRFVVCEQDALVAERTAQASAEREATLRGELEQKVSDLEQHRMLKAMHTQAERDGQDGQHLQRRALTLLQEAACAHEVKSEREDELQDSIIIINHTNNTDYYYSSSFYSS